MRLLRSALIDEPLPRLLAIAESWDLYISAATPRELAEKLPAIMGDRAHVERVFGMLPDNGKTALQVLLEADGKMPIATFERRFGVLRQMGPGRLERERPWVNPINTTELLWYRGLIFRGFDRGSPPNAVYYLPEEIRSSLLIFTPNSAAHQPQYAERTNAERGERDKLQELSLDRINTDTDANNLESAFLDDVVTTLAFIQNNEISAKASEEWHSNAPSRLLSQLKDPTPSRFAFLFHLLQKLWVRVGNDDRRLRLASQPVLEWLRAKSSAQLLLLFETWLDDATWNDLAHVPGLIFEMSHAWHNDAIRERKQIIKLISAFCQINQTGSENNNEPLFYQFSNVREQLDVFVDFVKSQHPDFARPDGRYDTWHIRDSVSREFLSGFQYWERIEGQLTRFLVNGPLYWLSPDNNKVITDAQRFALNALAQVEISPLRRFERFQLARVADFRSHDQQQYLYEITKKSIARAKEQGISAERVIEFLQKNAPGSITPALRLAIQRASDKEIGVKMEHVIAIHVKDPTLLDNLLSVSALRSLKIERLTPTCILCQENDSEIIQKSIVQNGLLI